MTTRPTMQSMREAMLARGYRNSLFDWEDGEHVYVFSREIVKTPGGYGQPCIEMHFRKDSGWYSETGRADVQIGGVQ